MTFGPMTIEEKLQTAVEALHSIRQSDPGPSYYIAKRALELIEEPEDEEQGGHA